MDYKTWEVKKNIDERGFLSEIFRRDVQGDFKQVYVATLKPGAVRANHYHKSRREWFCIIKGKARITLWDKTGWRLYVDVDGNNPQVIEVPTLMFHKIENIGKRIAILVSAASDLYDKNNPDSYTE